MIGLPCDAMRCGANQRCELTLKSNSTALKISGIIFAAILGLIVLIALFDWNMLRPYINRKVSEATGRGAKDTFKNPDVGPYKGPIALKAGAVLALAAINPLAAVLPLVNVKKVPDPDCASAIAQAEKPPAVKTPKVKAPNVKAPNMKAPAKK